MINDLIISYTREGVKYTLSTNTRDENLPYNITNVFTSIIKASEVNPTMVIDKLKEEFGEENNI